jgi:dethiobiotin synthetase
MRGVFITGVGTDVGKTLLTTILCRQLTAEGRRVVALKPVVSGYSDGDPGSDPACILRSLGRTPSPEAVAAVAPWRFAEPVSPHLAARREGRTINLEEVVAFCRRPEHAAADVRIVEGAGGIMSPIGPNATCLDWIVSLGDPVVLVTGSYLGAISHTLTALGVLRARGVGVRGIVVSESIESAGLADTVESLREFAGADAPVYVLPRLAADVEPRWRDAPSLTELCIDPRDHADV